MNYKKIDQSIINQLLTIVSADRLISENINDDYTHDEMPIYGKFFPELVIKPLTTDEISKIMKLANENLIPVTVRGSGTGLVGGCLPVLGGILLDMSSMNRIGEVDEKDLSIVVEPGAKVEDVKKAALGKKLFYPPEPGEGLSSIGGNISTNAAGMNNIKYGSTRDYVKEIEIVTASGEVTMFNNELAKSSSGYQLLDLLIGSEGTLAIITKVKLRLVKAPTYQRTCLAGFKDLATCIKSVPAIMNKDIVPQSLEFFDIETVKQTEEALGIKTFPYQMANEDLAYYLLIRLDGNDIELIDKQIEKIGDILFDNNVIDVMVAESVSKEESIWKVRSEFLTILNDKVKNLDESDVVVPVENIVTYVEYVNKLCRDYNLKTTAFGHAGDGNIHFYFYNDDLEIEEFKKTVLALMDLIYQKAHELNGCVSGEHGIGYGKKQYLIKTNDKTTIELMKRIKQAFDPNSILNPQKIF